MAGFTTAKGTKIAEPAAEYLKKAKALEQDVAKEFEMAPQEQFTAPQKMPGFATAKGTKIAEPSAESRKKAQEHAQSIQKEVENEFALFRMSRDTSTEVESERVGATGGFSTANGKKIHTSDASLNKALEEFEKDYDEIPIVMGGFSTAKGRKIDQPSDEQMRRAQSIFDWDTDMARETPKQPIMGGFSTAKGNQMKKPSAESMKKAQTLFEKAGQDVAHDMEEPSTEKKKAQPDNDTEKTASKQPMLGVFTTAKGNQMKKPSAESMKKAQNLFEKAGQDVANDMEVTVDMSKQFTMSGFSTAKGHKLDQPSAEKMKKAQLDFEELTAELSNEQLDDLPEIPLVMGGFSTAKGNKMAKPSDEQMKKAQANFDKDTEFTLEMSKQPMMGGFATAKGNQMKKPSAESMKKAQNLFEKAGQDVADATEEPTTTKRAAMGGFATARGSKLPQPSEESLKKAESILQNAGEEIEKEQQNETQPIMGGFSTGKGNKMKAPNEEQLKKAKAFLMDNEEEESTTTTTSTDTGTLSKEAREALVQDLLLGIDVTEFEPTSPKPPPSPNTPLPVLKAQEKVKKFSYPKSPGSPATTPVQSVNRAPIGVRPPTSEPRPKGAFGRGSRPFSTPRNLHPTARITETPPPTSTLSLYSNCLLP